MNTILKQLASLSLLLLFSVVIKANISNNHDFIDLREHFYKIKDSYSAFEVRYNGKIIVTDDDSDIKSISPNGYFIATKSSFGNSRTIQIESDENGKISKQYLKGKKEVSFEPEGQEWLEEIFLDVIRNTDIGGRERVLRIYNKNGIDAVFNEIGNLVNTSAYSYHKQTKSSLFHFESFEYSGFNPKYLYYKTLVYDIPLNKKELIQVLDQISYIESNSTKGTLLREILNKYELDFYSTKLFLEAVESLSYNTEKGNTLRAFISKYQITKDNYSLFFEIIDNMTINSEKGNVIKPLLEKQKLDVPTLFVLLEVVDEFNSDSEKAAIYRLMIPLVNQDENLKNELIRVVNNLSSSYRYLQEELIESIANGKIETKSNLDKSTLISLLNIAETYNANTKKTTKLRRLHGSLSNDREVLEAYFTVINSMDHDMEKYNLLLELIKVHKLNEDGYAMLLENVEEIANNNYKHGASAILRAIVDDIPGTPDLTTAFFDALEEIDHNSGKEEIIRMYCKREKVGKRALVHLLKAVEDIDVDVEKATALLNIKNVLPGNDDELGYIFESVASDIKTDYEYERVTKK